MAVTAYIQGPDSNDECCDCPDSPCADCGLPTPTISCVSKTGSANLRGWTNYTADVSDWNTIKYTRRDGSGDMAVCFGGTFCADSEDVPSYKQQRRVFSGHAVWNTSTNLVDSSGQSGTRYNYDSDEDEVDPPGCGEATSNPVSPTGITGDQITGCPGSTPYDGDPMDKFFEDSTGYTIAGDTRLETVTKTQRSFTGGLCSNIRFTCAGADLEALKTTGTGSVSLSIPDTIHAALLRGSPTTGSSCRTSAGTKGSTSAGSTTQIAISSTRSVRTTFACTGLSVGVSYDLSFTETQYSPGTNTVLNTFARTVTFVASGTTANVDYDNVVNTDGDYECSAPSIAPT